MKETYLSRDFRETAAERFPTQAKELNAAFDARLNGLLAENVDASKENLYHLKRQILPGIAAYETLQTVMSKKEALQTVHSYVERGGGATNSLSPCCVFRGCTGSSPAFSSNPREVFSALRQAFPQKSCRPATAYGVWT